MIATFAKSAQNFSVVANIEVRMAGAVAAHMVVPTVVAVARRVEAVAVEASVKPERARRTPRCASR